MAGIDLTVVSYKGTTLLTNGLLGVHIELSFGAPIAGTPEQCAENIAREESKWAAVAKKLGVGAN
jgi:hypothetical protein